MQAGPLMRVLLLGLVLLAASTIACAPSPPEEPVEIETEDVDLPIDAELSTEDDLKAVERASPAISGLLPGDVPSDLPVFSPSSVVDFGELGGGRSYVELDAGARPDSVRAWLGERLPGAGWSIGAIGDTMVRAHKGPQTVEYRLTALGSGTRIRLEYESRR